MLFAPKEYAPNAPVRIIAARKSVSRCSRCSFAVREILFAIRYKTLANAPARTGHATHVPAIFTTELTSVTESVKKFQPIIAPTTACDTETGRPILIML